MYILVSIALFAYFNLILLRSHAETLSSVSGNIVECTIYGMDGKVLRQFGGSRCAFLKSGDVIQGRRNHLERLNADLKILWSKKISTHHQLNLNHDETEILAMTSSQHRHGKKLVRYDNLAILDLNGKTIKSFDFYENRKQLEKVLPKFKSRPFPMRKDSPDAATSWEAAHANSFYEIPDNDLAEKVPELSKGNYIVNVNTLDTILIFDKNLKKVIYKIPHEPCQKNDSSYHDVQVLPSGKILIYNNNTAPACEHSSLDLLDITSKKKEKLYQATPAQSFYSKVCGGVQILATGNILFSDITQGGKAFEIDRNGKIIWQFENPIEDEKSKRPEIFQQIKRIDVTDFLKKNPGL